MPSTVLDKNDYQGGAKWGKVKTEQAKKIDEINRDLIDAETYKEYEDLEERLSTFKTQFMEYDTDDSGDLDPTDVAYMLEKLGKNKNILEIKKMIAQVDLDGTGTINYHEYVQMMLGKKNSILRIILMFEEKSKEKPGPSGVAPVKRFEDLP
ncbi:allograft inflammatory factor 1-like [Anneissia japonica]|uniref:allograft inflammatory factor 1-like n=1 Tax=Anneissia japonica TaxID=1529436 RepID=UPI0014256EEE|nr:allograft inflammatory factor 1-like [Anneissia japonica]